MKIVLSLTLLIAGAGLMPAAIIERISLDLSALHAGSILSGTFSLSNSPTIGDTALAMLSFTDPSDYSPASLTTTITVQGGTPSGFAVDFSPLAFINLSGTVSPINSRDITLNRFAFAMCASFPCTSAGGFEDRNPAVFRSTYTITPVPEPGYALFVPMLLAGIVFGRQLMRLSSSVRSY